MRVIQRFIYENSQGEQIEFSTNSVYHVNVVNGLSDIHNEIYSFNAMGQDGDTFLGNRIQSRDIEIVGNINLRDKESIFLYRRQLTHILNPHMNATLTYQFGNFKRVISCKVNNAPIYKKNGILYEFTLQLICLDPFWREQNERRHDIASWHGAFEFILEIPDDHGIEMGYREPSLIINVYNAGDVRTGVRIVLRALGTVSNPRLLHVGTGEFLQFNDLTLYARDVLTVYTHYGNKRITLTRAGVTQDAFRYLDVDSTYLQLDVGDNLFRCDTLEDNNVLEVSIFHSNRYLGV